MDGTTYQIPKGRLAPLLDTLGEIARRAERLGQPAPTWEIGPETRRLVSDGPGDPGVMVCLVPVTVAGCAPRLGGWTVAAVLDHEGERPVVRRPPDSEPIPRAVLDGAARPKCDHCRSARQRKRTFLLRDGEGMYRQVGSSCLGDFTGAADPHLAAALAEQLADLWFSLDRGADLEGLGLDGGSSGGWLLDRFLAATAREIRLGGWISRTAAGFGGPTSTADRVVEYLFACRKAHRDRTAPPEAPTVADEQEGRAALAWACAITVGSEFVGNVRAVAEQGFVPPQHAGIAAAIVSGYQREQRERAGFAPGHFGAVGERETFTLDFVDARTVETAFGVSTLVRFRDGGGRLATWWASGSTEWLGTPGTTLRVKATVKGHKTFRGQDQTDLSRVSPAPPEKAPRPRRAKAAAMVSPAAL